MSEKTNFSRIRNLALICFSSSFGGLELSAIQLAREFNARGAKCVLVVPIGTPLAEEAVKHHLPVEHLRPLFKYGDLKASWRLAQILRSYQSEIALIMQSKDINIVAGAKLLYKPVKLVYYQQMQSSVNKRDTLHTWMYSRLSLWVSLTRKMKQEVVEHTRVPERLIRVVPLGRDTHIFDPALYSQRKARIRYGLPVDRPIVAVLGRLDPKKGQEEFLRSLPKVREQVRNVCYVIAGEETKGEKGFRDHLVNLSNELGIGDSVRFLPFTRDVSEFLAAIDIFVLPSYSETFGLVLIEAMAMEKPVVATNTGGVPEIVEDHRDGLLIPPRDEKALGEAIILLLEDSSLRASLAKRAREHVLERFDSSRCVDQLVLSLDSL
jgi:D-inositol-3-phosphate glycosyltransferase